MRLYCRACGVLGSAASEVFECTACSASHDVGGAAPWVAAGFRPLKTHVAALMALSAGGLALGLVAMTSAAFTLAYMRVVQPPILAALMVVFADWLWRLAHNVHVVSGERPGIPPMRAVLVFLVPVVGFVWLFFVLRQAWRVRADGAVGLTPRLLLVWWWAVLIIPLLLVILILGARAAAWSMWVVALGLVSLWGLGALVVMELSRHQLLEAERGTSASVQSSAGWGLTMGIVALVAAASVVAPSLF